MRHMYILFVMIALISCSGPIRKVGDSTHNNSDKITSDKSLPGPDESSKTKDPSPSAKYQNQWQTYAKMPFPNNAFAIEGDQEMVFLAGGYTPAGYSKAFFSYNVATNTWKRLPDLPNPRAGLTLTLVGKYLYALGGVNQKGATKQLDIFDLDKNEWLEGPPMIQERFQHSTILYGQDIWVCGGLPSKKEVEYFSLESRSW